MATCSICERTGETPSVAAAQGPGPWARVRITELWKAGDGMNAPEYEMIVCSKTCAIQAILQFNIRDVEHGGEVPT